MKFSSKSLLKPLISTTIIITCSCAFANTGWYVGAFASQNDTILKTKNSSLNTSTSQNMSGYAGGAFFGYNYHLNGHLYLAAELSAQAMNNSTVYNRMVPIGSGQDVQISYTQSNPSSYGFSFIPNYQINRQTSYYLRLGVLKSRFKKVGDTTSTLSNYNNLLMGYETGVGVQANISSRLALRGEFDYLFYPSFTDSQIYTVSPSTQQFTVALLYSFSNTQATASYTPLASTVNSALYYTYQNQEPAQRRLHFDGPYVGIGAGLSSVTTNVDETRNVSQTVSPTPPNQENAFDFGNVGANYSAYFGYGTQHSRHIYLGIEGSASYDNIKMSSSANQEKTSWSYTKEHDLGLALMSGYILSSENMMYAKLGLAYESLKRDGDYLSSTNFTDNQVGLLLGFGYEFSVSQNMSLRADYTYEGFPALTTNTTVKTTNPAIPGATIINKISTKYITTSNTFALDLLYRF